MKVGLQLTPQLLGTKLASVLIGDDQQCPYDQNGQDLAQDAGRAVRHQVVQLRSLTQPTEHNLNGPTIAGQKADLVRCGSGQATEQDNLLATRQSHPQHAELTIMAVAEVS